MIKKIIMIMKMLDIAGSDAIKVVTRISSCLKKVKARRARKARIYGGVGRQGSQREGRVSRSREILENGNDTTMHLLTARNVLKTRRILNISNAAAESPVLARIP